MPDIKPLDPIPIDPPDNTGGGRIAAVDDDEDPEASEVQPRTLTIDPPDNTGGGR